MTASLFAMVGTSEHDFTRLVTWLDTWIIRHEYVDGFVQYGTSTPPAHADGQRTVSREHVLRGIHDAFVVVTHGGPGTIMDARSNGHIPIVVPRSAELGEHIDDHQVLFARRLARSGWIHLAETEAALHQHLDTARKDPSGYRHAERTAHRIPAVEPLNELLDDIVSRPPGFVRPRRFRHLFQYYRKLRPAH